MKKKILFLCLLLLLVAAGFVYRRYFSAPESSYQRNVSSEKSVAVTAVEIVRQFKTGELSANQKYLNQTVSVTGEVSGYDSDSGGNFTITLKSADSTANVFCTLKSAAGKFSVGSTITVKGICTGLVLNDVVLNEAVIVK